MGIIEILGTATSLIGILFNIKKMRICFVIWLISNFCWIYVQAQAGIWGMVACQVAFIGTCIWGWIEWGRKGDNNGRN